MAIKITTALLEALNTTVRTTFYNAYEKVQPWYDRITAQVPSGSASNTYPFVVSPGAVREWESGERIVRGLQLGSYQIFNKRYELTIGINKDQLGDDMTGALLLRTRDVADKFRRHPDKMVAAILTSNPLGLDGVALFSVSHPRNPASPVAGEVFANLFGSSGLNATNLARIRAAMMTIRGADGDVLATDPRLIIVPPELELTARKLVFSTIIGDGGAGVSNVQQGMYQILVVPQLSVDSTSTWYLADVSTEDKPIIMQPRDGLEIVTQFSPSDPGVFNRNEYVWGATVRYGFGPGSPHRIAKCQEAAL